MCLRREPRLLLSASALPALRETYVALCKLMRESENPARFASAIAHRPALLLAAPDGLGTALDALRDATGLNEVALSRVLRREPGLLLLSAEAVATRLEWLAARLGIETGGRLQRVVQRSPTSLLVSTSTMEARLECLQAECGVDDELLGPLIVRTPNLLHRPLASIRERAGWLRDAGVVPADAPPSAVGAFLGSYPDYYTLHDGDCDERLAWLEGLGLARADAAGVLASEPRVLDQPLEGLQLRAQFFLTVIGGSLAELCAVPHMLTCDLVKVPMLRHAYCLANGIDLGPTQLLTKTDVAFCMEVAGITLEELNEFEAEGNHLSFFQGSAM